MYCFNQITFLSEAKSLKRSKYSQVPGGWLQKSASWQCPWRTTWESCLKESQLSHMPCPDGSCGKTRLTNRQSKWVRKSLPCQQNLAGAGSHPAGWFRCSPANQDSGSPVPVTPGPVLSSWSFEWLEQHQPGKSSKRGKFSKPCLLIKRSSYFSWSLC